MKKLVWFVLALLLVSVVSGCGGKTSINTGDGTVSVDKNGVTIQTKDGNSEINVGGEGQVALPAGYPSEQVPLIEGAKITAAVKTVDQQTGTTYWITFNSGKSFTETQGFYDKVLADTTNNSKTQTQDGYFAAGTKGTTDLSVAINTEDQGGKQQVVVQLVVIVKP